MNWSALSKAIRAGVISLNLVILPIALPVAAQTGTASGNSTAGSNTTSKANTNNSSSTNDANLSNSPTPSNSNPGTSDTSSGSTSGTSATPSPSSASASPSAAPSPSNANPSPSATPSSADTSTAPSQGTTSTGGEHQSEWGLLGLLGLIGLAGLLHRTATPRETASSSSYASDRLDQGLTQAGVGASGLWNRLSTRASESRRRRAREKEIKQIKNALGRPSNRVILDRQDNIILNVGDLITNQAVERARMNNMLDVLLDSVDAKTPEIAEAEHSAPVSGEASLEKREREPGVDDH